MPLRNIDKIFYKADFTRNLPIGNYSLYYLTSKTLVFRSKLNSCQKKRYVRLNDPYEQLKNYSIQSFKERLFFVFCLFCFFLSKNTLDYCSILIFVTETHFNMTTLYKLLSQINSMRE